MTFDYKEVKHSSKEIAAKKSNGENPREIVSQIMQKGHNQYLSMRIYEDWDNSGELRPTKSGIWVNDEDIQAVLTSLLDILEPFDIIEAVENSKMRDKVRIEETDDDSSDDDDEDDDAYTDKYDEYGDNDTPPMPKENKSNKKRTKKSKLDEAELNFKAEFENR